MTQPNAKLVEVARAMASEAFPEDAKPNEAWIGAYLPLARAAIRALMEPSEDMVEAGSRGLGESMAENRTDWLKPEATAAYRAMLAKVLEEEG